MTGAAMLAKPHIPPMFYRILSKFPGSISMCFGYGSGVKQQLGYAAKKQSMIDLIYCVENPYRWHAENLEKNPSHYSAMQLMGSSFIAKYQEDFAARVYFNTLVPMEEEGVVIKYGVISTQHFLEDVLDWRDLYLSGRLHKPVNVVRPPNIVTIEQALDLNLKSAVHAALLLLPEVFTEYEFYYTIASLSYMGDFRMTFGENKDKVKNIVRPQLEGFRQLYAPTLKLYFSGYLQFSRATREEITSCEQDCSPMAVLHHLNSLPKWPIRYITRDWNRGRYKQDTEDVLRACAHCSNYRQVVQRSLNSIVFQSSAKQSLKNIPTAGLAKTIKYSWAKVQKMLHIS